jgi:hypothetical protein
MHIHTQTHKHTNTYFTGKRYTQAQRAIILQYKSMHLIQQMNEREQLDLTKEKCRKVDAAGQPIAAFVFSGINLYNCLYIYIYIPCCHIHTHLHSYPPPPPAHTHKNARKHARKHAHSRTHIHTHTRTRTHIHTHPLTLLPTDGFTIHKCNLPKEGLKRHSQMSRKPIESRVVGVEIICGPIDEVFVYYTDNLVAGGANIMIEIQRQGTYVQQYCLQCRVRVNCLFSSLHHSAH